MKKNQYLVSIVIGLLMGAIVALFVGNTTTAILAGVITAGIATWVGSLQWSKAREFAVEEMIDRVDFELLIITIKDIVTIPFRAIRWFVMNVRRLMVAFATDVNARKAVLAGLLILVFVSTAYLPLITNIGRVFGREALESVMLIPLILLTLYWLIGIAIASMVVFGVASIDYGEEFSSGFWKMEFEHDYSAHFCLSWICQLINDSHGAIIATVRMLYIRTGNALRIIAYPFVLIPWGFVALANNKTGIATLSATALSGAHLSITYFVGGIDAGNVNFWLSLAIAAMAGVAIGKKIGEMREEGLEIPPLPAIRFRHQVELSA